MMSCGGAGVVSFSLVSEVVGDNLGTVMSVLESVWGLLLGNLSLALSALTAAASLLLGGSLSILNALISVVSVLGCARFFHVLLCVLDCSHMLKCSINSISKCAFSLFGHHYKTINNFVTISAPTVHHIILH